MTNFIGTKLQDAINTKLTADSSLMNLINNIYDYLPKDVSMPYIAIADITTKDFSTKTTVGQKTTVLINTFSNKRGKDETQQIMEKIYDVLHNEELIVTGYNVINVQMMSTKIVFDGLVYKGNIEIEVLSEKI